MMSLALTQWPDDALASPAVPAGLKARLRLIGQMEAWTADGESILPTGRKTRAVLAILAMNTFRPVLRSRISELLWSRRPEEQARASLRQEIHRLLEALGATGKQILVVDRDHLALRAGAVWVDVDEVLRTGPVRSDALALLSGELLEDLNGVDPAFDAWLTSERERLRDGARLLGEAVLREQNDPEAMIAAAHQLLAVDRAHEGAWRALMRAHAKRGERGLAIQSYERCRATLADQLDAQPSQETQRLLAEIRSAGATAPVPATPARADSPLARKGERRGETVPVPRLDPPQGGTTARRSHAEPAAGSLEEGARIGVPPLLLLHGSMEEDASLCTGLADEITTALARFRWMHTISSAALAHFASHSRDEAAMRRAFRLDFLLDGTIQRTAEGLRISLRLMDLHAGNQVVWSSRFDRPAEDKLALQDEIAGEVTAQIYREILLIEGRRAGARALPGASAYELLLCALPLFGRCDRALFLRAGEWLREAVDRQPDSAPAHACSAYWHVLLQAQGWSADLAASMAEAGHLAERAITLDPSDAVALTVAGHLRGLLFRQARVAMPLHERALSLNPNLAMAWNLSGVAFTNLGDLVEAERRLQRYKRLAPLHPEAFFFDTALVTLALLKGDHEAAVAAGRDVTAVYPGYGEALKPFLAALGHLGRRQEAAGTLERLLALQPGFTVAGWLAECPLEQAEQRAHFATGLRLAGVAE
jgi:DNA-binding SARP family transcriptional activator/TolB-like protein